jgi:SAM-dependent methyltransferase
VTEPEAVIWHDLECGHYREDLALWCELAEASGDPILDVGAGSGRVSLELARRGHTVVAVDYAAELLGSLARRAATLADGAGERVSTVLADARELDLGPARFALCLVPMQTIQLLGGAAGRLAFLTRARTHLEPGGVLALAIAPDFEEFEWQDGDAYPLPDIIELAGTVYSSQPTAVRLEGPRAVLERRREVIDPAGGHVLSVDRIALDQLSAATLIAEGTRAGLTPVGTRTVAETEEHVGSLVVIFRA